MHDNGKLPPLPSRTAPLAPFRKDIADRTRWTPRGFPAPVDPRRNGAGRQNAIRRRNAR